MDEIETLICVKTENQIMELIQEFASSWSLVGGRYDNGSMLENANNLKQEIRSDYEALQKENADLQLRLDAKTLSHQLMLDRTLGLQKENDDQKRKIIGLENELVEWNEFKKIRDAQMHALRKQMP
jgi:hypothetical protein